ncbi:MAG: GNAT family N-acetyltransferase [Spirochaetia bacterium]
MRTIRPPDPSESGIVSELILQSDCGLLTDLFGPGVRQLLSHLQSKPSNPYSSVNTLVIADDSSPPSVVGALVGSRADTARRSNLHTAALLIGWYGPGVVSRFFRLARAGRSLEGLEPDDFYLSHIAVLPALRGRGAGGELLRAGEARARQQGVRRLVLDVEENNDGARSFYARMGYRPLSVIRIDPGRRRTFSFLRLSKGL